MPLLLLSRIIQYMVIPYKEIHIMRDTTTATNNQQVIDENLQPAYKNTFILDNEPLKRPNRRRLKRAAEKEAKKETI